MKTKAMVIGLSLLLAVAAFGHTGIKVSALTGYTMTAFEDQDDAAGTLPVGLVIGKPLNENVELGLEVKNALGGFTWELDLGGSKFTSTFAYTVIDVYGKYVFSGDKVKPYVKGGLGYFIGNLESESGSAKHTSEIDPGIGFVIGGGAELNEKFFAEFSFNVVSRKGKGSDESMGMNTWAVLVGYKLYEFK